jgi:hypothetical protein
MTQRDASTSLDGLGRSRASDPGSVSYRPWGCVSECEEMILAILVLAVLSGSPDRIVRIESVARVDDGGLGVLDLTDAAVRTEVRAIAGGRISALYESSVARRFVEDASS